MPEKNSETSIEKKFFKPNEIELKTIQKKDIDTEHSPINLRRASSTVRVNVGASLAGLGAEFLKRRQEMFPSATK